MDGTVLPAAVWILAAPAVNLVGFSSRWQGLLYSLRRTTRNLGRLANLDPTGNTGSAAARIAYPLGAKEAGPLFRRFHWTYLDTAIQKGTGAALS
jgi:hypothetical protein